MNIVLVGGGHAHLKCLLDIRKNKFPFPDQNILLISPNQYQYYSGMFSGYTEGLYSEDEIRIDLKDMAEKAGVTFTEDIVTEVSVCDKTLMTKAGASIPFSVVSFDTGSYIEGPSSFEEYMVQIKPNYLFADMLKVYRDVDFPVVVGGGASGVEIALAITAWRKKNGYPTNVKLITSSKLLPSSSSKTSKVIKEIAVWKGLTVIEDDSVEEMNESHVITQNGRSLPHSQVLWLTGPSSPDIFKRSTLPCDQNGFLLTEKTLQAKGLPFIFGAGDCITLESFPDLPKNGVYAVRQAELLWKNITSYLNGEVCSTFTPQRQFLSLLSTGNKEALLQYGRFTIHSKLAWKLKNKIDTDYMQKYI
ncbi:pyridine nucleotide-disulfide oxidoreductase [Sutcliffiella horikoshii]|uniref:Pyridine nucleotide-disulfide oxidoreductase n=1 Tax=Sutcliffiella horikoshii TaxID=79883 RepID=A0A1Y0CL22_9BACI|nr:FAD-dependent oxidoreductase [Sutcliffiella horikoshii]ART75646.1 pyridine nucleotide-disulfide oxidoreductase [Sutcliffiella horikoshii]TYS60929.1 pyridine nucleotide-disulfide oxidoreductase [Sutcliffiella horikoshii]